MIGIRLARETIGGDALVVFLFGLFHDAMRENDDNDPDHGRRGAVLFRQLASDGLVSVTADQSGYVTSACETHTTAPPTPVVPVGICYDADRLTLWRIGTTPDEKYLSTRAGKEKAHSRATQMMHGKALEWAEVLDVLFSR